jgi:hypothetical protein
MARKRKPSTKTTATTLERSENLARELNVNDVIRQLLELSRLLGQDVEEIPMRINLPVDKDRSSWAHPHASLIGELLRVWHQDVRYLDKVGNPMRIKMSGGHRSFRRLAGQAVPNIHPRQILGELLQIGAVSIDGDGYISAQTRSLSVYQDKRLAVMHTLESLNSFISTLRHNLASAVSNSEQLFHRVAWTGEFDPKELPALKVRIRRHGQEFLESCDNWMARRTLTAKSHRKKAAKVSIGVYLSVEER